MVFEIQRGREGTPRFVDVGVLRWTKLFNGAWNRVLAKYMGKGESEKAQRFAYDLLRGREAGSYR